MRESIPTDRAYNEGTGLNTQLSKKLTESRPFWDHIDWAQDEAVPEHIREFTTASAAQFHYAKTSHFLLYQELIDADLPEDLRKLAVLMSAYNLDRLEVWGRYLEKRDAHVQIHPKMRQYYARLFEENDPVVILLGMETMGVVAKGMYGSLKNVGDPVFREITESMESQKAEELELATEWLETTLASYSSEECQQLVEAIIPYLDLLNDVLASFEADAEQVRIDAEQLQWGIQQELERFYREMGLKITHS